MVVDIGYTTRGAMFHLIGKICSFLLVRIMQGKNRYNNIIYLNYSGRPDIHGQGGIFQISKIAIYYT
jgi:hypothetical protein